MAKELLLMRNITKTFPGVRALKDVCLDVEEGEIHAIVGENGAGKSTLMNILSGVYPSGEYEGEILFDGEPCVFRSIRDSEDKGIVIIHQELALVPYLSIAENVFLGNERARRGVVDWDETYTRTAGLLEKVHLNEKPSVLTKDLGVGKQQLVEIAKALSKHVRLLILDEPTAALNDEDSGRLLTLLLDLKAEGITSIIISHKLNEVEKIADRITVLRDGAVIETLDNGERTIREDRIIKGMVGREIVDRFPKRDTRPSDEIALAVENWTVRDPLRPDCLKIKGVSFTVRRGEVVGLVGLMGAGRTELAMSIFGRSYGMDISGRILLGGEPAELPSPKEAIGRGLAYLTEDRKSSGLILIDDICRNISLASLSRLCGRKGVIDCNREVTAAEGLRKRLGIKTPSIFQKTGNLSGGNQQKTVLARWILADPDVLLLDEPTRGIDVGAKYEIYCIINELAAAGKAVVLISSEMPEVLGMSDRIYVMNEGRIVGELSREEASQEAIMKCIMQSNREVA